MTAVAIIEVDRFEKLESMFERVCNKTLQLETANLKLSKEAWLSTKDSADYLGLHVNTIERYKDEIGYSQPGGRDRRFKIADLDNWMMKSYVIKRPNFKLKVANK